MFLIGEETPWAAAVILLIGLCIALMMAARQAGGENRKAFVLASVLVPLFGVFFSHLAYCLVNLDAMMDQSIGSFLAFWQRGHMVYGAVLGGWLALCVVWWVFRASLFDAFAPSFAVMIAAFRLAEGCMGIGYGEYLPDAAQWIKRIPFMMYDPWYEDWAVALFALEALAALILAVAVMLQRRGYRMHCLLGLYASFQIVLESLRRDEFLRWGFVRVEELLSAVCILAVLIVLCTRIRGRSKGKTVIFGIFALMVTLCILLEFATEGRIPFLLFLSVEGCYAAMLCACVVLAGCVVYMRNMALDEVKQ